MKVEVNVPRKWAYVVLIALLLGSGAFAMVMAFNPDYATSPNREGANVAKFGHSPDEIIIELPASGLPSKPECVANEKVTLHHAIRNGCLAGSGDGTTGSTQVVVTGTENIASGAAAGNRVVNLPAGAFSAPPKVVIQPKWVRASGDEDSTWWVTEVTATSFKINWAIPGAGSNQGEDGVMWVASGGGSVAGATTLPQLYRGAKGCGNGVFTENFCYPLACPDTENTVNARYLDCETAACTGTTAPPTAKCNTQPL